MLHSDLNTPESFNNSFSYPWAVVGRVVQEALDGSGLDIHGVPNKSSWVGLGCGVGWAVVWLCWLWVGHGAARLFGLGLLEFERRLGIWQLLMRLCCRA